MAQKGDLCSLSPWSQSEPALCAWRLFQHRIWQSTSVWTCKGCTNKVCLLVFRVRFEASFGGFCCYGFKSSAGLLGLRGEREISAVGAIPCAWGPGEWLLIGRSQRGRTVCSCILFIQDSCSSKLGFACTVFWLLSGSYFPFLTPLCRNVENLVPYKQVSNCRPEIPSSATAELPHQCVPSLPASVEAFWTKEPLLALELGCIDNGPLIFVVWYLTLPILLFFFFSSHFKGAKVAGYLARTVDFWNFIKQKPGHHVNSRNCGAGDKSPLKERLSPQWGRHGEPEDLLDWPQWVWKVSSVFFSFIYKVYISSLCHHQAHRGSHQIKNIHNKCMSLKKPKKNASFRQLKCIIQTIKTELKCTCNNKNSNKNCSNVQQEGGIAFGIPNEKNRRDGCISFPPSWCYQVWFLQGSSNNKILLSYKTHCWKYEIYTLVKLTV